MVVRVVVSKGTSLFFILLYLVLPGISSILYIPVPHVPRTLPFPITGPPLKQGLPTKSLLSFS